MTATEHELAALCRQALPEWSRLRLTSVTPLPRGRPGGGRPGLPYARARAWALVVEAERGGRFRREELVLRRYHPCEGLWLLEDPDRAERAFALLRALEARGFPVPHAYAWGFEGGGWVLMERVADRSRRLSAAVVREGLCWLRRLHLLRFEGVAQAPLPHVSLVGVISRAARWAQEAQDAEIRDATAILARQAVIPEADGLLLHGNPCPTGLYLREGRLVGWLGWADSALGDPRWDLARFWAACRTRGGADFTAEVGELPPHLPLYEAALALRDWSAARCRYVRQAQRHGTDHPEVRALGALAAAARQAWLAAGVL